MKKNFQQKEVGEASPGKEKIRKPIAARRTTRSLSVRGSNQTDNYDLEGGKSERKIQNW